MSNHMLKIKFRSKFIFNIYLARLRKFVTFMDLYTRAKKINFIAQLALEMKLTHSSARL